MDKKKEKRKEKRKRKDQLKDVSLVSFAETTRKLCKRFLVVLRVKYVLRIYMCIYTHMYMQHIYIYVYTRNEKERDERSFELLSAAGSVVAVAAAAAAAAVVVAPEPMRADSGVDLGLSESLSQLTLKQVTLNPLASGKVQTEPTVELVPLADRNIVIIEQRQLPQGGRELLSSSSSPGIERDVGTSDNFEKRINNDEPWQLYYTQDDEGDT